MIINQKKTMSTSTVKRPDWFEESCGVLVFVIELLFDIEDIVYLQLPLLRYSGGLVVTLSQSISLSFKYDPLSTITFFDKKRWFPASLALAIITQEFKLSTSNKIFFQNFCLCFCIQQHLVLQEVYLLR